MSSSPSRISIMSIARTWTLPPWPASNQPKRSSQATEPLLTDMLIRGNWRFEARRKPLNSRICWNKGCESLPSVTRSINYELLLHMNPCLELHGKALTVKRHGLSRLCSLRDEYYDFV